MERPSPGAFDARVVFCSLSGAAARRSFPRRCAALVPLTVLGGFTKRSVALALTGLALAGTTGTRAQTAADSASVTAFYGEWFGSASQG